MQKNITSLSALNWDDLKFFLEVARTRKASSAAKRLAVDYTTVSRRISSLEGALGTLLFEKSRTNGFTTFPSTSATSPTTKIFTKAQASPFKSLRPSV